MSDYTIAVKYAMIFFMVTMAIEWIIGKWMKKSFITQETPFQVLALE